MYLSTSPAPQVGCRTRSSFKWVKTGMNSEFSFSYICCLTKSKELSVPYYLYIACGRLDWFMPFSRTVGWRETQTTLYGI